MDQQEYVRHVLDCYRRSPETTGQVRPADRQLAARLYQRQVPVSVVEAAILLATARRLFRSSDSPPLAKVRSLHYFAPVVEELLQQPLDSDYVGYVRDKLERHFKNQHPQGDQAAQLIR